MVGDWQRGRGLVVSCARAPRTPHAGLIRVCVEDSAWYMLPPSQPIETASVMAYGSQTKVACYTDLIRIGAKHC
jgi:hypothetical protein